MGKLTVAKFIPMTSIIPDSATAVSLTFLPDGIIVEAAWECSESFGWVQDKLREPGLRGPYGVGSAQGSAHWVTPFLILILSLEFECLSPFLQNTLGTRGSLILNKAGKQRSAAFGMFSSRSSHSEASSRRGLPFSPLSTMPPHAQLQNFPDCSAQPLAKSTFSKAPSQALVPKRI